MKVVVGWLVVAVDAINHAGVRASAAVDTLSVAFATHLSCPVHFVVLRSIFFLFRFFPLSYLM